MKRIILSILLVFSSQVFAQWDTWSENDKKMFVASSIAITADWLTTRDMSQRYNEGYWETNPILGRYPSTSRVDLYFIGMLVSNYYLADWAGRHRTFYLGVRTVTHGSAAVNNINIGLRLSF